MRSENLSLAAALLKEAEHLDREEMRQSSENPLPIYDLAAIEAIRNNVDNSFQFLNMAIAKGWTDYVSLQLDPRFESIRTDERFDASIAALKEKIKTMREKISNGSAF